MSFNNCKLIALEGIDRVGKSLQTLKLTSSLQNAINQKIPYRDGITYDRIYEMLKTGEALEEPYYFQSLQAINRLIWQKQVLPSLASQYDVVILDRWDLSAWVYGLASNCMNKHQLSIATQGLIEPDLYFVFDGAPFTLDEKEDSYESNKILQNKASELYRKYVQEKNNCILINANDNIDAITSKLVEISVEKLGVGKK